jgi:hypothetical protein
LEQAVYIPDNKFSDLLNGSYGVLLEDKFPVTKETVTDEFYRRTLIKTNNGSMKPELFPIHNELTKDIRAAKRSLLNQNCTLSGLARELRKEKSCSRRDYQ